MKFAMTFEIEKDDQMIVLTADEAKDLYMKLRDHFGEPPSAAPVSIPDPPQPPITYPVIPYYPTYPTNPYPYQPWTTGDPIMPLEPWTITCSYGSHTNNKGGTS